MQASSFPSEQEKWRQHTRFGGGKSEHKYLPPEVSWNKFIEAQSEIYPANGVQV